MQAHTGRRPLGPRPSHHPEDRISRGKVSGVGRVAMDPRDKIRGSTASMGVSPAQASGDGISHTLDEGTHQPPRHFVPVILSDQWIGRLLHLPGAPRRFS